MAPALKIYNPLENGDSTLKEKELHILAEKESLIAYFRDRYIPKVSELGVASAQDEKNLIEALSKWEHEDRLPTNTELEGWRWFRGHTMHMVQSAEHLFGTLLTSLQDARSRKLISEQSVSRWLKRFHNKNAHFKQREYFVEHQLPHYIRNWKEVKMVRDITLKNPDLPLITTNDVKEIGIFLDEERFLDLPYEARVSLVSKIQAAMQAKKQGMDHLFQRTEKLLVSLSSGKNRILHRNKVGTWLKRLFPPHAKEKDVQAFLSGKFSLFRKNWNRVRHQFDVINKDMEHDGVPRGLWVASLDEFLRWDFSQRESYIREAKLRLKGNEGDSEECKSIKQLIRHDLDTKDWDGADRLIQTAISQFGDDIDIRSMALFLKHHRTDNEDPQSVAHPQKTLEDLRDLLSQIPADLQPLYSAAMRDGYETFLALTSLMYNRVWCHQHGYLNNDMEAEDAENKEYKSLTRKYIREGHTKTLEKNIVEGDTAQEEAVREECTSPQVLYASPQGYQGILSRVRRQKGNYGFRYWTSLIPIGMSYGTHECIVNHIQRPMKSMLRTLEAQGMRFSLIGDGGLPQKKVA